MAKLNADTLALAFGEPGTDYSGDIKRAEIVPSDKKDLSYGELARGDTQDFTLSLEIFEDLASGGLWRFLYDNAGETVAAVIRPYGNASASASEPFIVGDVKIRTKPGVGGEASLDGRFTASVDLVFADGFELDEG